MALTETKDITFNDNFNDLPNELKNLVISYINIDKLVSYDNKEIDPLIDAYIKQYIETQLFTDASIFTFLRNTYLYEKIINEKIYNMTNIWAKDFMDQCEILNEKIDVEKPHFHICFNIKYNHRSINTSMKTSILYFPNINNSIIIIRNNIPLLCNNINTSSIVSEMISSMYHFMNMFLSGVYQIQSIELVKKKNSSPFHPVIYESSIVECNIIKKYY
jgi:hypothetical protein